MVWGLLGGLLSIKSGVGLVMGIKGEKSGVVFVIGFTRYKKGCWHTYPHIGRHASTLAHRQGCWHTYTQGVKRGGIDTHNKCSTTLYNL